MAPENADEFLTGCMHALAALMREGMETASASSDQAAHQRVLALLATEQYGSLNTLLRSQPELWAMFDPEQVESPGKFLDNLWKMAAAFPDIFAQVRQRFPRPQEAIHRAPIEGLTMAWTEAEPLPEYTDNVRALTPTTPDSTEADREEADRRTRATAELAALLRNARDILVESNDRKTALDVLQDGRCKGSTTMMVMVRNDERLARLFHGTDPDMLGSLGFFLDLFEDKQSAASTTP